MDLKEKRARFVYELMKLYDAYSGEEVEQLPFDERGENFMKSYIELVDDFVTGRIKDFKSLHKQWLEHEIKEGWKYGEKYSETEKTSPLVVSYDKLDEKEKIKDEVFIKAIEFTKQYIKE